MIPTEEKQKIDVIGGGALAAVANFGITEKTLPRILVDLSDKMYNNKSLAVIREYSTNAVDAMIKAKKPISDIVVTLPTVDDPVFKIRDFGSGLTEEEIRDVYCVFGESDKRNSNRYNGMFGYGCKSGFAMSDSFTVTSWVNNTKTVYQCIKGDTTSLHQAIRLSKTVDDEQSGIEVSIPIKTDNITLFMLTAAKFYRHWETLPVFKNESDYFFTNHINKFKNAIPLFSGNGWDVYSKDVIDDDSVVYMGHVSYPINWSMLETHLCKTPEHRTLFTLLENNKLVLKLKNGAVSFVNNREGLEYTDNTRTVLVNHILSIFKQIKESFQSKFDKCSSMWDAKRLYSAIFSVNKMPSDVDPDFKNWPNLNVSKDILKGGLGRSFYWKEKLITSSTFEFLNQFDNASPDKIHSITHEPINPVIDAFKFRRSRIKKVSKNNDGLTPRIVPFDEHTNSLIVLNVGNKPLNYRNITRYLIMHKYSGRNINTVYFLTFVSEKLKELFYSHCDFDDVPVLDYLSLKEEYKNYKKNTSVKGKYEKISRSLKYIDLDNETLKTFDSNSDIDNENAVYVISKGKYNSILTHKDTRSFARSYNASYALDEVDIRVGYTTYLLSTAIKYISVLNKALNFQQDKILVITSQIEKTKRISQKIESGQWMGLDKKLLEVIDNIDTCTLASQYFIANRLNYDFNIMNAVYKNIKRDDTALYNFLNKYYSKNNFDLINSLRKMNLFGIIYDHAMKAGFSEKVLKKEIYDFIDELANTYPLVTEVINRVPTKHVINYINMVDENISSCALTY